MRVQKGESCVYHLATLGSTSIVGLVIISLSILIVFIRDGGIFDGSFKRPNISRSIFTVITRIGRLTLYTY